MHSFVRVQYLEVLAFKVSSSLPEVDVVTEITLVNGEATDDLRHQLTVLLAAISGLLVGEGNLLALLLPICDLLSLLTLSLTSIALIPQCGGDLVLSLHDIGI